MIPGTSNLEIFEVKTSLGALSKNFVSIELDWRVSHVRVKPARVTAIWIVTFDEIVYENDKKHSQQLVYIVLSRVIFNKLFNIIRVCRPRYVLLI